MASLVTLELGFFVTDFETLKTCSAMPPFIRRRSLFSSKTHRLGVLFFMHDEHGDSLSHFIRFSRHLLQVSVGLLGIKEEAEISKSDQVTV